MKFLTSSPDFKKTISLSLGAGSIWLVIAGILGLLNQLQLAFGFPGSDDLSYGIIRPLFTSALIFGGFTGISTGVTYYVLHKESGDLKWEPLARIGFCIQQAGIILGLLTVALGLSKGREYGEWNWISDHLFVDGMVLAIIVLVKNAKSPMSPSGLFSLIGLTGGAVIFFIGNFSLPYSPLSSVVFHAGLKDSSVQELYRMGILGFFILFPAFSALYYFVPKHFNFPIYNEGAVKFQSMAMLALIPVSGMAFLAYGPGPQRAATAGIVFALALSVAIMIGAMNLHYTLHRASNPFKKEGDGSYLRWAIRFLIVLTILRAIAIPRFMQEHLAFTWWNAQNLATDAWILSTILSAGVALAAAQRMTMKKASGLASVARLTAVFGSVFILIANTVQGWKQGTAFSTLADDGTASPFSAVLFAGSVGEKTVTMQYLIGFRGLYLIGFLLGTISLIFFAISLISILRGKGEAFAEKDLHLPVEEGYGGAH